MTAKGQKRTPQSQVLRTLASRVQRARSSLAVARLELGRRSTPQDSPYCVEASWRGLMSALRARGRSFWKKPGVQGFGFGVARVDGIDTATPCLTVYVGRKLSPAALARQPGAALPRYISVRGRRLRVDVIPLGRLVRQAFVGQSLSTRTNGVTRIGTIGARGVRDPGGGTVLITAMHVTGLRNFPASAPGAVPVFVPGGSTLQLGMLASGSMDGIDAAMFDVTGALADTLPVIGRIRGWRPLLVPGDRNTRVRMFGAVSGKVHDGVIEQPLVELPGFGLDAAIVVRGFESVEGDSGAALIDPENLVLGFLVGRTTSGARLFCPAGVTLSRLGCDIPSV